MAEKFSGVRIVSQTAIEMRQAIIELAGKREWFETRERWIENAARAAGVSYRTAKALFYAERGDPRSSVVDKVRKAIAAKRQAQLDEETKARDDYRDIVSRLEMLEARLGAADPDFYREEMSALREVVREARGEDRPLDRG